MDDDRIIAVGLSDGHTQQIVRRSVGRDVLDTVRIHAGNGTCNQCGHVDHGDGHIAVVAVLLDGQPVDVLALAVPDPVDPEGDQTITPLAVVITPDLAERLEVMPDGDTGDDEDDPEAVTPE